MTVPSHRSQEPTAILSNFYYAFAKQGAMIILPAVGTLYFMLAGLWGLPHADKVVGTVAALNLFVGVLVGVAKKIYEGTGGKYDGTLALEPNDEGTLLRLRDVSPLALDTKDEIVFKVVRTPE